MGVGGGIHCVWPWHRGASNIHNSVVMESKKRRGCWEEGLLGSGWRPGGKSGVVEASFLHRSAARKPFLQAVLGGPAPCPLPRVSLGAALHLPESTAFQGQPSRARLTLCHALCQAPALLPAPRFGFAESTLGLDTLPSASSASCHGSRREAVLVTTHPWQSHGAPKPPLGPGSLELRLGSMPGYKETSLGSSPSWHPPSRLLSVLYTSAFLSLPFSSPI